MADESGHCIEANKAALEFFSCSHQEIIGKELRDLWPSATIELLKPDQEIPASPRAIETKFVVNGQLRPALLNIVPFSSDSGNFVYFRIDQDIVIKRRVQEEIRREGAYNRSLIEANLDPLVTISPDGAICDVNEATVRITGVARENLIDTDFSTYFTEPEKAKAGYEMVFRDGQVRDYPLEIRNTNGDITPVLYNATVFRDESGKIAGVFAAARDITERKKSEDVIRNLAKFPAENPHPVLRISEGGKVQYANVAAEPILAFWQIGVGEMVPSSLFRDLQESLQTLVSRDVKIQIGARTYSCTLAPIAEGRYVNIYGTDITDQARVMDSLTESEKRYRDLTELLPQTVFECDLNGTITFINKAGKEFFGYNEEDLKNGLSLFEVIPPEDRARVQTNVTRKFQGEQFEAEEYHALRKDRSVVPILVYSSPILQENRPVGLRGIVIDVSTLKKSAEDLRIAHQNLTDIIEFLPDATFVIDAEKKVVAWNRAMEKMTGVHKEEMVGKGDYSYAIPFYGVKRPILIDLIGTNDAAADLYTSIERQGATLIAETFVPQFRYGRGAHLWGKASPLYDGLGRVTGAVESIRDITERKNAELLVNSQKQQLRNLMENLP
ncbi:MAG: PAS domain-containing protein, partial [Methanomicrobiales archaeon]|nr:PAS domain-containing protein [Methanomicrobiales archaeon]